jgi:hypothetical protein
MHLSFIGNQIGLAGDVDNTALATLSLIMVLVAVIVLSRRRIKSLFERAIKAIDTPSIQSGAEESSDVEFASGNMSEKPDEDRGDISFSALCVSTAIACAILFFFDLSPNAAVGAQTTYRQTLSLLEVAPEYSVAKYDRIEHFGSWRDEDKDCLNTRAEVLIRDSLITPKLNGCRVISGQWMSIFDGKVLMRASEIQIDHLVPLREAWDSGAALWSKDRRVSFANDLSFVGSLSTMSSRLNGACKTCKSDKDPAEWLPEWNQCLYAQRWVAIKHRWDLSIDSAEKRVLSRLLSGKCGEARLSVTKP